MEKEFIVGKKYFVPKEDMPNFRRYCWYREIPISFSSKLEKPLKLLRAFGKMPTGSIVLDFETVTHWRFPPEAIALIKLYEEYVQEEMEL